MHAIFFVFRFERCQSEESRPSVWQRFKSFEESDAVRRNTVAGERPSGFGQFVSGTLPRPRATVKPLPVPDTTKGENKNISTNCQKKKTLTFKKCIQKTS